ncbi:PAAR domain-containing protein [Endozoicomonas arenosclerae]|uniref:PAAR domain-containing protein n=1 Tax=Endozoicomonas arenosclerae TaxID=1633495 RepID=UPI0009A144FD|nr:PAAR domain-containing protein [Endozoicomonas arenosclerae]
MGKPAARLGDMHLCPKVEPGPVPHVGGPVVQGSSDVLIGSMPAARVGDMATCIGPPDKASAGSATVLINGKAAARMGDSCGHGGTIIIGCPTVLIGDGGGSGGGGGTAVAASQGGDKSHLPPEPETLEACEKRLIQAEEKLVECRQSGQPIDESPYSNADKERIAQEGSAERFVARVVETQFAKDEWALGPMRTEETTSYWTAPFTQVQHNDHDAELHMNGIGVPYDPEASYSLMIIDTHKADEICDVQTIIPTTERISQMALTELSDEFKGKEILIEPAMSQDYSVFYEHVINTANEQGADVSDPDKLSDFAIELGYDEDQADFLEVRHEIASATGANEQFLGNGLANNQLAGNPETPFGTVRHGYHYGPNETVTLEKNPRTQKELKEAGILKIYPLKHSVGKPV